MTMNQKKERRLRRKKKKKCTCPKAVRSEGERVMVMGKTSRNIPAELGA